MSPLVDDGLKILNFDQENRKKVVEQMVQSRCHLCSLESKKKVKQLNIELLSNNKTINVHIFCSFIQGDVCGHISDRQTITIENSWSNEREMNIK